MESSKKYYILAGTAGFLIVAAIIGIIFVEFDIEKKADEVGAKNQEVNLQTRSMALLTSLQKDSEKAKQYNQQLDSMMITSDQLFDFKNDVIETAKKYQLSATLNFVGKQRKDENGIYQTGFTLSVSGQGGIININNFLTELEGGRYFIKIAYSEFKKDGNGTTMIINGEVASLK